MRIIAGTAKGRKLSSPSGNNTRPITDRIKEALFNVINSEIQDSIFLDLFAGSGSVGIEALSRGAKNVIFIDKGIDSIRTINENLQHCNFTTGFEIYKQDVFKALDILDKRNIKFDIIYIDPPFTISSIFEKTMDSISKTNLLKEDSILIIRTPKKLELKNNYSLILKYRENNYGESTLNYYRLSNEIKEGENHDGNI